MSRRGCGRQGWARCPATSRPSPGLSQPARPAALRWPWRPPGVSRGVCHHLPLSPPSISQCLLSTFPSSHAVGVSRTSHCTSVLLAVPCCLTLTPRASHYPSMPPSHYPRASPMPVCPAASQYVPLPLVHSSVCRCLPLPHSQSILALLIYPMTASVIPSLSCLSVHPSFSCYVVLALPVSPNMLYCSPSAS